MTSLKEFAATVCTSVPEQVNLYGSDLHHRRCGALILEDDLEKRVPEFRKLLPRSTIARNPLMAIAALDAHDYTSAFLDFDVPCPEMKSGLDVARRLAQMKFVGLVVIHSSNRFGASLMADVLTKGRVRYVRAEFGDFRVAKP